MAKGKSLVSLIFLGKLKLGYVFKIVSILWWLISSLKKGKIPKYDTSLIQMWFYKEVINQLVQSAAF